ncbi:hypothetical protein [Actinomadura violacea]|uniref:Uncharacterized protein n=1 Tax=Actinomadura violacea TaxID=2819934 RepID=A0ABS3S8Y4_9ACTN|nr:hypothetical protein [Actinomadura violacea]MBO2465461.1 hypothetical protein [Actinomadura violacea]
MAGNGGMGTTWHGYPPVHRVLDAHATCLAHQQPALDRYITAAHIADRLRKEEPDLPNLPPNQQARLLERYRTILRRDDWSSMARMNLDPAEQFSAWFLDNIAARLQLLT